MGTIPIHNIKIFTIVFTFRVYREVSKDNIPSKRYVDVKHNTLTLKIQGERAQHGKIHYYNRFGTFFHQ